MIIGRRNVATESADTGCDRTAMHLLGRSKKFMTILSGGLPEINHLFRCQNQFRE